MGFLIWFHVVTEKEYSYELRMPVTEITLQDGLTLSKKPPDSLLVAVTATGKQLLRKNGARTAFVLTPASSMLAGTK